MDREDELVDRIIHGENVPTNIVTTYRSALEVRKHVKIDHQYCYKIDRATNLVELIDVTNWNHEQRDIRNNPNLYGLFGVSRFNINALKSIDITAADKLWRERRRAIMVSMHFHKA